ncbi:MAG: class I SAM-dependent methyltransferase [Chloroflexi bacterium]|nr:class I SAM-dependent methyltransferase [Chloroflexota bacterium]
MPDKRAVVEHNRRMWDRLAKAGIPYTRLVGTPPRTAAAKRRFLDPRGRYAGVDFAGARVLSLAGGGGWHPILFAELGADVTLVDISAAQCRTVRESARARGAAVRVVRGDMRDLSRFAQASFDVVDHQHSLVFVPDAARVIRGVGRVLAPGGTYLFSTMHPTTLRLYGTWTGTGWRPRTRYADERAIPYEDDLWEFGRTKVRAPTIEYGHRIETLVNACVKAGMVVDGLWEWSPGDGSAGEPGSDDELERWLPAFVEIRARKSAR